MATRSALSRFMDKILIRGGRFEMTAALLRLACRLVAVVGCVVSQVHGPLDELQVLLLDRGRCGQANVLEGGHRPACVPGHCCCEKRRSPRKREGLCARLGSAKSGCCARSERCEGFPDLVRALVLELLSSFVSSCSRRPLTSPSPGSFR